MTRGAIIFMLVSWTLVLGLAAWAFARLMRDSKHHDPDGIGPGVPPVPAETERRSEH